MLLVGVSPNQVVPTTIELFFRNREPTVFKINLFLKCVRKLRCVLLLVGGVSSPLTAVLLCTPCGDSNRA